MSDYTEHYNLKKPKQTESYNVEDANSNNDIIDKTLFKKQDKISGKGLSTNDFTNEYKNKIDNLQKIYRFKGNVENYAGLSEISASNGDIYNVINEAKNYAWNGTEWVQLGFVIDMSEFAYKEEIPTKNSQLENDSNFASFPSGGYKGQILEKKSNNDNDVEWVYNDGGITGDTLPIGSVVEFASDNIPDNWLLCNGQAVSRTDYAELFAAIGTTWGTGDGSTTFNLPTKEGLVTVGKKTNDSDFNALGKTGGEKTHTLTVAENPSHSHGENITSQYGYQYSLVGENGEGTQKAGYLPTLSGSEVSKKQLLTDNAGGGQPHNNLQPYTVSNFIIKAKQSSGVVATVVDNLNSTSATDALSAKQGKELNDKISEIIESGSNSNGKYIKFSDGTMICRGIITITVNQSRISGGLTYYSNETYFDFPVAFIDTDIQITTNIQLANMNLFAQTYALAESKCQARISLAITQNNESRNIDWVAIGKWK